MTDNNNRNESISPSPGPEPPSGTGYLPPVTACIAMAAALVVIWWAYLPGFGAPFHFDTPPNLQGLVALRSFEDMIRFVLTGQAGPTGRPISLLTFALQAEHWPDNRIPFRQVNAFIHVLNGALLAWALFLLAREHSGDVRRSAWIALLGAVLWAASPLLASTSLSVIQRMTSLSALFVFAGVIGHLHFRRLAEHRPRLGLVLMSASLVVFTLLATLSKENGLLLPLLVLVIEFCLLRAPRKIAPAWWTLWRTVFLLVPLLVVLAYLASRVGYSDETMLRRDFNAWERLLTQALILWEYLFHAFIPAMHRLGLFHDHYPVARSLLEPRILLAVLAWIGAVVAAVGLRKRLPVLAFAIFWYLGAHLLESTVLSLELYFEHRNYIPLVGPMFAVAWGVFHAPESLRRILLAGVIGFLLLCVFVLHTTSSLWGNRELAGQVWYENNPESTRATMYYGQELTNQGDITGFLLLMDQAAEEIEDREFALLQGMRARCHFDYGGHDPEELATIKATLPEAPLNRGLPAQLQSMYETRQQIDCVHYTLEDVYEMSEILVRDNPGYSFGRVGFYPVQLVMGRIRLAQNDQLGAIEHFEAASKATHELEAIWILLNLHVENELFEQSCRHFTELRQSPPQHFYQRRVWLRHIDEIMDHLKEAAQLESCQELL